MLIKELTLNELQRHFIVVSHSWAPATLSVYGTSLLLYHVYCDLHNVAEERRTPAQVWLLHSFIADCAGGYARTTIENAVAGVRAWHHLHGIPGSAQPNDLERALRGVGVLALPKNSLCAPLCVDLM
jgi:hypothetical protein